MDNNQCGLHTNSQRKAHIRPYLFTNSVVTWHHTTFCINLLFRIRLCHHGLCNLIQCINFCTLGGLSIIPTTLILRFISNTCTLSHSAVTLNSTIPSFQIVVNFHCCTIVDLCSVNIWKMQRAPMSDIWVGQKIWFESEIFATGKNVEKVLGGGQTNGVKWYDGKVLSISSWKRSWIQFSVGVAGQEGF